MATLTEVFPCFFLSCKTNTRVNPERRGTARTLPNFCVVLCIFFVLFCSMYFCVVPCIVCFVSSSVLFVCICVLYYCHWLAIQLQLNISYIISLRNGTPATLPAPITGQQQVFQKVVQFYQITLGHTL
jgi:hypothetical protein